MKKAAKIIFALALIAAGIIWGLYILNVITFEFDPTGWWAFFVIIPCFFNLFFDKDKVESIIGMGVGVLLFLAARSVITWNMFWQLGLALLIIGFGVSMLFFKSFCRHKEVRELETVSRDGKDIRVIESSFGRQTLCFSGEKFEGADVKASFCGLSLDLRDAVIEQDVDIRLEVGFSGVEIICPAGNIVKVNVNSGFGGVKDSRMSKGEAGSPVIFINGSVGFGGVEIK